MSEHGELVRMSQIRRPESTLTTSFHCDPRTVNIWNAMKSTILEIMRHESSKEVITDTVYNAVRMPLIKNSDFIYADLYGHLEGIVDCIAESILDNLDNELLWNLLDAWDKFRYSLTLISHLFPILDGVVARETDCSFANVGRAIFENGTFQDEAIRDHVTAELMRMAEDERRGVLVDRCLFRHACATLRFMSVCDSRRYAAFEKKFLEESRVYYRSTCQELLATGDTVEYLSRAERVLYVEECRLGFCLQEGAARAMVVMAEAELVQKRLHDLVALESNGIADLLAENRTEDMALLYRVVRRVPMGRSVIAHHVNLYLEQLTRRLLEDIKFLTADAVVESVFKVRDQLDALVQSSFSDDKFLKSAVCLAFRNYVTCDERLALFLAQYTDAILSYRSRDTGPDVDAKLSQVLKVTSLLSCKDAVLRLHKVYLSVRLLRYGPSFYEELAASGLQFVLGASLADVRGMLQDMKRSDILTDIFQRHPKVVRPVTPAPPCEFSMRLLSSAFWPLVPPPFSSGLVLPPRPNGHLLNFQIFYATVSTSRQLVLLPQYGTAEVLVFEEERRRPRHFSRSRVSFASTSSLGSAFSCPIPPLVKTVVCRLEVSTVQMCLLWLFNDAVKLTVADMASKTGVDAAMVLAALEPLCSQRVLLPVKPEDFTQSRAFRVNRDLGKDKQDLKLYASDIYYTSPPTSTVEEDATRRRLRTDVVILRVMKAKQVLPHDQLVAETVRILRDSVFLPTSLYVTRRINALVQRNMLKRKPEHSNIYSFT